MVVAFADLLATATHAASLTGEKSLRLNRSIQDLSFRLAATVPVDIFDPGHMSAFQHHIFRANEFIFPGAAR